MRHPTKLVAALAAATVLSLAVGVTGAFAALPEWVAAKSTVTFTSETAGKTKLNARNSGVLGGVECEHSTITGTIVAKSPKVEKVKLKLSGHCEVLLGEERLACFEPLESTTLHGTVGFIKDEEKGPIGFKLSGESGTEVFNFTCRGAVADFEGSVVAEVPEINNNGKNQYNKSVTSLELKYSATETKQAVQTLLTAKGFETGLHLKAAGLFGGEASLTVGSPAETLKPAESIELKS